MTFELWPWQRHDVDALAANGYVGVLAYEPGAGKTNCAVQAIVESGAQVTLIIAPKSTFVSAWIPTLAQKGLTGRIIGNGKKAEREAMLDFQLGYPGVYLTTSALIGRKSTDISGWSGDMLIADEVHGYVTMGTNIQRRLSGYNMKDAEPLNARFPMRIGLSGTPLRQSPVNLWGLARLIYPEYANRYELAHRNAIVWMNDRLEYKEIWTNQRNADGSPKKVKQFEGEKVPGQWISEAPSVYIHKRREHCCAWHGPRVLEDGTRTAGGFLDTAAPQVIHRKVELTAGQKKAIRELQALGMTYLESNPLVAELPIVQQQRIRQVCMGTPTVEYITDEAGGEKALVDWADDCESPMIDELFQILSELPEEEPVIVYLDSRKFARVVTARLNKAGISAAEYSGATTANRDQYLEDFGTKYRVIVGVMSAVGTGTNGIQAKCSTEVWMEQPVKLVDRIQTEARTDRAGSKAQTQRFYITDSEGYAEGRLDDHIVKRMALAESLRKVA